MDQRSKPPPSPPPLLGDSNNGQIFKIGTVLRVAFLAAFIFGVWHISSNAEYYFKQAEEKLGELALDHSTEFIVDDATTQRLLDDYFYGVSFTTPLECGDRLKIIAQYPSQGEEVFAIYNVYYLHPQLPRSFYLELVKYYALVSPANLLAQPLKNTDTVIIEWENGLQLIETVPDQSLADQALRDCPIAADTF